MVGFVEFVPEEPTLGPPKPFECVLGPMTHRWTVSVEEGQATYHTDECRLCSDGLNATFEPYEVEVGAIQAGLVIHTEHQADDVWTWLEFTPIDDSDGAS